MQDIPPRYWAMIATLGFVWGSTFLLISIALEGISPLWLATSRIVFASLLMIPIWGLRSFRLFESETGVIHGAKNAAKSIFGSRNRPSLLEQEPNVAESLHAPL